MRPAPTLAWALALVATACGGQQKPSTAAAPDAPPTPPAPASTGPGPVAAPEPAPAPSQDGPAEAASEQERRDAVLALLRGQNTAALHVNAVPPFKPVHAPTPGWDGKLPRVMATMKLVELTASEGAPAAATLRRSITFRSQALAMCFSEQMPSDEEGKTLVWKIAVDKDGRVVSPSQLEGERSPARLRCVAHIDQAPPLPRSQSGDGYTLRAKLEVAPRPTH